MRLRRIVRCFKGIFGIDSVCLEGILSKTCEAVLALILPYCPAELLYFYFFAADANSKDGAEVQIVE